jgi:riboflavin biosynthesis pyrimidine reductase
MAFDQRGGVADGAETQLGRFTCPESLDMVHRLRRDSDAVLVGRSTVESDDCTLTVRRVNPRVQENTGQILQPVRVVLDPKRTLLAHCDHYKLFTDGLPTIIYHVVETTDDDPETTNEDDVQPKAVVEIMEHYPNVQWIGVPACSITSSIPGSSSNNNGDHLSIKGILEDLANHRNIHHVMVEGGPATARVFLNEQMVDRAIFVYAPMKFQEPIPSHLSQSDMEQAGLEMINESKLGVDRVEYWCRPGLKWPPQSNSEGGVEIWP